MVRNCFSCTPQTKVAIAANMKKIKIFRVILFILSIPVSIFPQDFKTVHDGVEYAEVTKEISGLKVNMNLLRLDLTKVRIDVVHAMDEAIGVEKTSSIATRYGALAAINAGFFRLDNSLYAGDAAGIFMIDRTLLSESQNNRVALFINNFAGSGGVSIAHMEANSSLRIKGKTFHCSGINRERKENEIILYTSKFHRTTLTDKSGVEIVVSGQRITAINSGLGSSLIPEKGYVISINGKMRDKILPLVRIGRKITVFSVPSFRIEGGWPSSENILTPVTFFSAEDIVGGVPQLIRDGKIDITWEKEGSSKAFVETRHPRTAVAKLKDGKFLMITVDGRSEISGGIGLQDLAEYLLSLGAIDAMNLDGGGSTTMFVGGKVVNRPSDKEGERKVSDALLVTPRKR
jgi:exopolysaccharide biosynthesis protein